MVKAGTSNAGRVQEPTCEQTCLQGALRPNVYHFCICHGFRMFVESILTPTINFARTTTIRNTHITQHTTHPDTAHCVWQTSANWHTYTHIHTHTHTYTHINIQTHTHMTTIKTNGEVPAGGKGKTRPNAERRLCTTGSSKIDLVVRKVPICGDV